MKNNVGRITQVLGAVVDVQFPSELPAILNALHTKMGDHTLVLVTKGDLLHQETKLAASGLGELFWRIEIVSEKDVPTYQRIIRRHEIELDDFVMVGNSVRSDVLPVLELGAKAVHVPYHITWELEYAAVDDASFPTISTLRDLVSLVDNWS